MSSHVDNHEYDEEKAIFVRTYHPDIAGYRHVYMHSKLRSWVIGVAEVDLAYDPTNHIIATVPSTEAGSLMVWLSQSRYFSWYEL